MDKEKPKSQIFLQFLATKVTKHLRNEIAVWEENENLFFFLEFGETIRLHET